ncbi:MAG: hypothetical protein ACI9QN_001503 [Arcticibacterium sp.]|jgi:hypothetical protein
MGEIIQRKEALNSKVYLKENGVLRSSTHEKKANNIFLYFTQKAGLSLIIKVPKMHTN